MNVREISGRGDSLDKEQSATFWSDLDPYLEQFFHLSSIER